MSNPTNTLQLILPIGNGLQEVISAEGELLCSFLKKLASLLRLSTSSFSHRNALTLCLSPNAPPDSFRQFPQCSYLFQSKDGKNFFFQIKRKQLPDNLAHLLLIQILHLALLQTELLGSTLLLHAALLLHPVSRNATVLFGRSGMGKSTAAERFRKDGGITLCDDRLLLSFQSQHQILAQPLPTWSLYPDIPSVPFSQAVPVNFLTMLYRGTDDTILPANAANWKIALANSMNDHLSFPPKWLPRELKLKTLQNILPKIQTLQDRFGTFQLEGDLQGHIFQNLSGFL